MCASRLKAKVATSCGQQALRPMHAIGVAAQRQLSVRTNQEKQAARATNRGQLSGSSRAIVCAKMPVNNGCSARQVPRNGDRIGRTFGISEEIERWNRWCARITVEPRRCRR